MEDAGHFIKVLVTEDVDTCRVGSHNAVHRSTVHLSARTALCCVDHTDYEIDSIVVVVHVFLRPITNHTIIVTAGFVSDCDWKPVKKKKKNVRRIPRKTCLV